MGYERKEVAMEMIVQLESIPAVSVSTSLGRDLLKEISNDVSEKFTEQWLEMKTTVLEVKSAFMSDLQQKSPELFSMFNKFSVFVEKLIESEFVRNVEHKLRNIMQKVQMQLKKIEDFIAQKY